jgi:hypothetical protein
VDGDNAIIVGEISNSAMSKATKRIVDLSLPDRLKMQEKAILTAKEHFLYSTKCINFKNFLSNLKF